MKYYVYYSYEEFGRGYIGCRQCNCDPESDRYFGSYHNKSFKPTCKIILQEFETYEDAINAEIALHTFFDVAMNPHFANLACQKTSGFSTAGTNRSEKTKQKHRETLSKNPEKCASFGMLGKKHSEETKRKMSETTKQQIFTDEARQKMSVSAKLRIRTKKENQKIAETLRNKPRIQCPHCDKKLKEQYMPRHLKMFHSDE